MGQEGNSEFHVYPPLLRGPPCCKVHQWEGTHYQGAHSHTHNEQHILGPLMMVWPQLAKIVSL